MLLEYAKICIVCPALRPKIVPYVAERGGGDGEADGGDGGVDGDGGGRAGVFEPLEEAGSAVGFKSGSGMVLEKLTTCAGISGVST